MTLFVRWSHKRFWEIRYGSLDGGSLSIYDAERITIVPPAHLVHDGEGRAWVECENIAIPDPPNTARNA